MKGPEAQIQVSILEYLAVRHIWAMRINTGAMFGQHNGKNWAVRFAKPGTADILCTFFAGGAAFPVVGWIEVKAPDGKQSEAQIAFQEEVEAQGHKYILARSIEDVAGFVESMTA